MTRSANKWLLFFFAGIFAWLPTNVLAQANTMPFQAFMTTSGGDALSGVYCPTFRFVDIDTGEVVWDETQCVTITDGSFSTQLGSVDGLPSDFRDLFTRDLRLELILEGDTLSSNLSSVPFAMYADQCTTADVATTALALASTNVGTGLTVSSSGVISINANSILESHLKIVDSPSDEECLTYESTGGDFEWQSCGSSSSDSWSSTTAPTANMSINQSEYTTLMTWDTGSTAAALDAFTIAITNDATTDSTEQRLFVVKNSAASGGGTTNVGIAIENADDGTMTSGLVIAGTGTGAITTAIDASDADIGTALAIGANDITTSSVTISSTELARLDGVGGALLTAADTGSVTAAILATDSVAAAEVAADAIGSSELAATAVTAGAYGSATQVATFTVDADGRLTAAANTTITGAAPGGAAGGDLTGTYPNPTITTNAVELATDTTGSYVATVVAEGGGEITVLGIGAENATATLDVGADTVDFAELEDTLDLDTALTLNQTTNTWSQSFTGTTTDAFTYTATSLTTGKGIHLDIHNTSTSATTAVAAVEMNLDNLQTTNSHTSGTYNGLAINYTLNTATGIVTDDRAMKITVKQNDSATGDTVAGTLLLIENLDTATGNTTTVGDAIRIESTTGSISTAIDVADPEIDTALDIGTNDMVVNNGADVTLSATELSYVDGVTSSIQTQLNTKATSTLADGRIFVGNSSNVATAVAMSGDATIVNTGALTIAADAIGSSEIAADTIAAVDIATGGVATAEILDGTIAAADIAAGTITTTEIATDTIAAADIATGGVATAEILDGTIAAADIAAGTITTTEIATDTIAAADIAADAVGDSELDTSIAPTWTGAHTFQTDVDFGYGDTENVTLTSSSFSDLNVLALALTQADDADATDDLYGLNIDLTANSGDAGDTVTGLRIVANDAGTDVIDTALLIDNQQATDIDITDAIKVQATTNASIATAINVSDAEITTALNIGANDMIVNTGSNVTLSATELSYVDGVTSSIQTQLDGKSTSTLADGKIFVGNSSNVATAVAMSGDATIVNTGALTIAADAIGSSEIAADTIAAVDIATGGVATAEILDGTIAAADIAAGTITTTEIATDTIAAADIAADAVAASEIAADAVGASEIVESAVMAWTGNHSWTFGATGLLTVDAATTDNTGTAGVIDMDVDAGNAAVIGFDLNFEQSDGAATATDAVAQVITLTGNDADGDMFGLKISAAATVNAGAGTYEAGIVIDNAENTAGSMPDAILITATTDTATTDAIDVSDAEIVNALNIGANNIVTSGATVSSSELDALDNGIESADIAADTIAAVDIATGGVATAEILDGTIAAADIAAGTITTTEIATDTIAAVDIATGGVATAEILDGTIAAADIAAGTITTTEIAADTIAAVDIATGGVATAEILDGTIAAADIAAGTITTTEIAADTIAAVDIATGGVATAEILDGTITSADVGTDLDFADFDNALDLDANTTFAQGTATWTQSFTGTTTTGFTYDVNSLTSGKGILINADNTAMTSGHAFAVVADATTVDTGFTGAIAEFMYTPTYSGGVSQDVTGRVLYGERHLILNNTGNTLTVSGPVAKIEDQATLTAGTLTHTADALQVIQGYTSNSGSALNVTTAGTGYALRVNDNGTFTDTTAVVVNDSGHIGIGVDPATWSDPTHLGLTLSSAATTETVFGFTADSVTTGKGFTMSMDGLTGGMGQFIQSSSTVLSSGILLEVEQLATSGSTAFTGDVAKFNYQQTFNGGVALESSGNVVDITRHVTLNNTGNTHTVNSSVVSIKDTGTQTAGTLTNTASVLTVWQSYTNNSGPALWVAQEGTGNVVQFEDVIGDTTAFVVDTDGDVGIGVSSPAGKLVFDIPAAETIAAAATITADGCGTVKMITSASTVTTNTTDTFTAPAAANEGCCMRVTNTGSQTITLDANANFKTSGGTNKDLGQFDAVEVCSTGASGHWFQVSTVLDNS